jgi:hypothetical protein
VDEPDRLAAAEELLLILRHSIAKLQVSRLIVALGWRQIKKGPVHRKVGRVLFCQRWIYYTLAM